MNNTLVVPFESLRFSFIAFDLRQLQFLHLFILLLLTLSLNFILLHFTILNPLVQDLTLDISLPIQSILQLLFYGDLHVLILQHRHESYLIGLLGFNLSLLSDLIEVILVSLICFIVFLLELFLLLYLLEFDLLLSCLNFFLVSPDLLLLTYLLILSELLSTFLLNLIDQLRCFIVYALGISLKSIT